LTIRQDLPFDRISGKFSNGANDRACRERTVKPKPESPFETHAGRNRIHRVNDADRRFSLAFFPLQVLFLRAKHLFAAGHRMGRDHVHFGGANV
jgi:hypothetical protein